MTNLNPHPTRPQARAASLPARLGGGLLALLCLGVAAYSARYLMHPPQTSAQALGNVAGVPWLFVHVAGSVTALVLGSLQFLPVLRRGPQHRWVGRIYLAGCLIGGTAGLILAPGSFAGPIATAGFGSLAILWITVTLLGWCAALQGRFVAHRRWMIRSWALTLAAVTLRLYLPLVMILDLPFLPWYRAIAFLCWVPNLIAAELWLRWRGRVPLAVRPHAAGYPRVVLVARLHDARPARRARVRPTRAGTTPDLSHPNGDFHAAISACPRPCLGSGRRPFHGSLSCGRAEARC